MKMVEHELTTPISEADARKLRVGDTLYINGLMITARDQAHRRIIEYAEKGTKIPVDLDGSVIFHCGPIMKEEGGKWVTCCAGPTTSTRMNALTPKLLEKFKVRVIIGKGGMSGEVAQALKRYGAVYSHFTGGAAVLAAKNIREVEGVEWLDLGMPEAMWKFSAVKFGPLTVTIDSTGRSFYGEVKTLVESKVAKIYEQIG
jgi:fumarate hydratase subunit beta